MGANQGLLKSIILENKEKKNPTITDLKGQNPRPLCTTALKYMCGFCCLFLIIAITIGALVPVFIGNTQCDINPCKNQGVCLTNGSSSYSCQCPRQINPNNVSLSDYTFIGTNCETYNSCWNNTCMHNSNCSIDSSNFTCKCQDGYYGPICQSYNSCWNSPCEGCQPSSPNSSQYICTCNKFNVYLSQGCKSEIQQPLGISIAMIRLSDNRAASAFDDYTIRIAPTTNGGLNLDFSQAVNLTIHTDFVMSLIEIKPNIMASGSCDKSIRIWDVSTTNTKVNESIQNISDLDGCINSLANVIIDDSSQMIAAASGNATIWIFKLNKNSNKYEKNQPVLTGHNASINAIVYDNPTQSLYTGSDDNSIKVWNYNNGLFSFSKTFSNHSDRVITLIIYNKNYLISGSADSLIKVWSLTENKLFKDLKLHTQAVTTLTSFNLLGNEYFASGSLDTSIVIWDTVWNNITNSSVHIGQINSIVFFSNSSMMASASTDTKIILWPFMPNMRRVKTLSGHKRQIESVYILQNTLIASTSDDNTTKIWDSDTGTTVSTLIGHTNNVYVAVGFTYTTSSNQSQLLIATGSKDRSIIIWDQMKFNLIYTLYGHLKSVLAIAPLGGSKIASGSCDKSIIIWSLDPPTELLYVLTGHTKCVNALIPYLNDYIISGSDDGKIILWNWKLQSNEKTLIASFNAAVNQTVNALASFNNKYLAAALGDGSIQIFSMNAQNITLVRNISAHSNSVLDVKFSNNGNLASASKDKTIKVWDVNTYKNIFINSNHNSSVLCLAVMPNANLVSGSEDKTIQIFNTNLYSNNTIIF